MAKKKVINQKNKRIPVPVIGTMTLSLFLDKFNAPGWLWGALGVFIFFYWCIAIHDIFNCEELEEFK
tara:strand:- start:27358 stop:27558 length:201 start_codon:yes stop_codon:yes gene_type:complete